MEIIISDKCVTFNNIYNSSKRFCINTVSYQFWESKDELEFLSNQDRFRAKVSQTTVNGVQMTQDNIDELLSPVFVSTGSNGGNDSGISTVTLSAAEYEALEVKDPNTIYYVY